MNTTQKETKESDDPVEEIRDSLSTAKNDLTNADDQEQTIVDEINDEVSGGQGGTTQANPSDSNSTSDSSATDASSPSSTSDDENTTQE